VDDPVQPRAEAVLGLEVEDRAMDPVLGQRPEAVAQQDQRDRGDHGHAVERHAGQDADRRHEDHDGDGRVDARELVEPRRLEHRRRGLEDVRSALRVFHTANVALARLE
jgi:hypothetical protein